MGFISFYLAVLIFWGLSSWSCLVSSAVDGDVEIVVYHINWWDLCWLWLGNLIGCLTETRVCSCLMHPRFLISLCCNCSCQFVGTNHTTGLLLNKIRCSLQYKMAFLSRLLRHLSNRVSIYFLFCINSYLLVDAFVYVNVYWFRK